MKIGIIGEGILDCQVFDALVRQLIARHNPAPIIDEIKTLHTAGSIGELELCGHVYTLFHLARCDLVVVAFDTDNDASKHARLQQWLNSCATARMIPTERIVLTLPHPEIESWFVTEGDALISELELIPTDLVNTAHTDPKEHIRSLIDLAYSKNGFEMVMKTTSVILSGAAAKLNSDTLAIRDTSFRSFRDALGDALNALRTAGIS